MMTDLSCREFVDILSGDAPVPGGGGASAYVGAIGTALGCMVGSLTTGKKKYQAVEEDIQRLIKRAKALQAELLVLVDRDAEVFSPLSKAYGMPKNTPEELAEKERVMESCLRDATEVPLEIMRKCSEGIDICREFAEKGSRLVLSDAGVGVTVCKAALFGASLNVFINTKSIRDRAFAEACEKEADELLERFGGMADEVFAKVAQELRSK